MVAKNDEGHVIQVPGLILESKEEARRFLRLLNKERIKEYLQKGAQ